MKREFKIGVFIAIALFILALFIFIVGDLSVIFQRQGYPLFASFDSVAGLEKRAVVRMAGVKAGYVKDIRLLKNQAQVVMSLHPEIKVPLGSKATLAALGLLGEKYIEILPEESQQYYKPGETMEGLPPVSFDQIGNLLLSIGEEVREAGKGIKGMIGDEASRESFHETLENLSALTSDLRHILGENREEINRSLSMPSQAIKKFEGRVEEVSQNLDELISLLRDTVQENREEININLKSIKELLGKTEESLKLLNEMLEKINKGEGSLGRLIQKPDLYEETQAAVGQVRRVIHPLSRLRFSLGLRADYYGESELTKPSLTFRLWSDSDKFLMTQILRDPWLERFVYSAQVGIRWGVFSPRAGIMESNFGAGVDVYALQDRLRVSVEGFDFNRHPRPQLRMWTRYAVSKYIYLLLGIDDFTLAAKREIFFGFGVGLR
jgi:ABC-type transporter Mla subunit MlaD